MCKIIKKNNKPSNTIDECIREELQQIEKKYDFKREFKSLMSCCGHGKYPKTFVVMNRDSSCVIEWFTGNILEGINKRRDGRKAYYKRDKQGYYFIPEIFVKKEYIKGKEKGNEEIKK